MSPPATMFSGFLAELVGEPLHVVDADLTLREPPPFVGLVVFAAHRAGSGGGRGDEPLDPSLLSLLLLLVDPLARGGTSSSDRIRDLPCTYTL